MKQLKHIIIKNNFIEIDNNILFDFEINKYNFNEFAKKIYLSLNITYPKYYKMSNMCKLGLLASELLLQGFDFDNIDKNKVAIVLSCSSSSINTDIDYQKSLQEIPSPALFVYTLPNIVSGEICIRNGFKGEEIMFVQEDFDKEFLLNYVDILFKEKKAQICISGFINFDENNDYLCDFYLLQNIFQ